MSWVSRLLRPLGPSKQSYREPLVGSGLWTAKPSRREREAGFDALLRELAPSVRIRYEGSNVPGIQYVAAAPPELRCYRRSPLEAYLGVADLYLIAKNPACTLEERAMLAEYIRSGRARRDLCGRRRLAQAAERRLELEAQLDAALRGPEPGDSEESEEAFDRRMVELRRSWYSLQAHDALHRPEHYGPPGSE